MPQFFPQLVAATTLAAAGPINALAAAVLAEMAHIRTMKIVAGLVVFGAGGRGHHAGEDRASAASRKPHRLCKQKRW